MRYNGNIERKLLKDKMEVLIMLKDLDFGFYGKGIDGYVHYSLAMDRIREEEKRRKAIIDDLDRAIEECRMKKRETDDFYDFEDTSDTDDIGDIDDFGF